MYYDKNALFRYSLPSTKILVFGVVSTLMGTGVAGLIRIVAKIVRNMPGDIIRFNPIFETLYLLAGVTLIPGIACIIIAPFVFMGMSDAMRIKYSIKKGLFCYKYGNPLKLKDHEQLPKIKCKKEKNGLFALTISATSSSVKELTELSPYISSMLNKKYCRYAVTRCVTDLAFNNVTYYIEDVTVDNSLIVNEVRELCPKKPKPYELRIDKVHSIDLTSSQSMIVAGKTRSGKTTAIISLLSQALLMGRDDYGSQILIIDPKQAELSRLPHTVTLDDDGGARAILQAMRKFAESIKKRQKILNDLSEKDGNAVHWWDVGMHPSFIFIDEYVSLRSLFPKRSSKEEPDYCLAEFDNLVKRIVTMGASSGSFAIISIAEASVDEKSGGGIPAMIRSACTTKLLFEPTSEEAKLLWNHELLADFNSGRIYEAGDAWFSSTDGIHDFPTYAHFPILRFGEYASLRKLLEQYYAR